MGSGTNKQVQQSFVAAVFSGDIETIRGLVDPDFELREGSGVPFAGVFKGADGFFDFLKIFGETFDIEQLAPVRIYESADPDWLASEFDLRAVVRSNGEIYETTLIETWQFRDGKVLAIKPHYFNAVP